MPLNALINFAKTLTPRGYAQIVADDENAPMSHANLVLIRRGIVDGDGNPDPDAIPTAEKFQIAAHIAYSMTLAALDLTRTKVQEAKATPAEAKFRKEQDYLEMLLKRLAAQAEISDVMEIPVDTGFEAVKVDYFEC